jgi:hypothetical protein
LWVLVTTVVVAKATARVVSFFKASSSRLTLEI